MVTIIAASPTDVNDTAAPASNTNATPASTGITSTIIDKKYPKQKCCQLKVIEFDTKRFNAKQFNTKLIRNG
ncbi:hypothetical protein [Lentilactobacillus farraginis]|uniref:hypothetical protein n=1 Tax=Lentilactobacillus farraginis TaxID=390841 RepID=UPI00055258EC|nr:hypothetical protein [Lentilactobacillus farraginis]